MKPNRARAKWFKLALGLLFLAAVLTVLFGGLYEDLDAGQVRAWLQASGIWGPLVFVLAFAVLQPVGLSAHVFIIAASLVWSPALALPLSWTGATLAGCTAFGFARFIGRDWVQGRIPERVQGYDEALVTKGFRTVLVLRLTLFTFGPMQLMLGVSKVRLRPYVLGTALGLLPLVAAETLIGASLVEWLFERA